MYKSNVQNVSLQQRISQLEQELSHGYNQSSKKVEDFKMVSIGQVDHVMKHEPEFLLDDDFNI